MLKRTKRLTLVEQVTIQLQELIETGQWPVGMRIPAEPELVAMLGVSRNTIREAVRAMVHAGLLNTKPGDGTYVCSSSALGVVLERRMKQADPMETLEVRHALEQEAARLAAVRRTEEDLAAMRIHLDACEQAVAATDFPAFAAADILLHKAIVASTHNRFFIDLYEHMTDALHDSVSNLVNKLAQTDRHSGSHAQAHLIVHREMVEAIQSRNAPQAAQSVQAYIDLSKIDLQQQ